MADLPASHPAIAVQAMRQPLIVVDAPTQPPRDGEVVVKVEWAALSMYHGHQADGGLLIDNPPVILGDAFAGTIAALGPGHQYVENLKVGDAVIGYSFRKTEGGREAALQTYITLPSYLLGPLPKNLDMKTAVSGTENLICVFQTVTENLELPLPWPRPDGWTPPEAQKPILIWGGAGSVGMYSIELLKYYGYQNILAVASSKHHSYLKELGATACFDYRESDVTDKIRSYLDGGAAPYLIDCIGHLTGSVLPLTKLADRGSKVAVMLPIIIKEPSEEAAPEYQMTAPSELSQGSWKEGVEVTGVRTHFYLENELFKTKMSPEIVPTLLGQGAVRPNPIRVIEGDTLLQRVENALKVIRRKEVSGEKLVVRVE